MSDGSEVLMTIEHANGRKGGGKSLFRSFYGSVVSYGKRRCLV